MDLYSVKMPEKVSPELKAKADRIEKELTNKNEDEESILRKIDSDF